ncbi:MAG: FkbM family methyltransferase [Candidatus Odinarchaeia archaeon]
MFIKLLSSLTVALKVANKLPSSLADVFRRGGLIYVFGYIAYYFSHFTGISIDNPFWNRLRRKNSNRLMMARVLNYKMFLDISDKGISRQLILEGKREKGALKIFTQELKRLQEVVGNELIILDIGANIGYYVGIEALIAPYSKIYAVEPSPVNVELLAKNVEINQLCDRVDITTGAISNKTGESILFLSNQSNVHSMERQSGKKIKVKTWTVDDFIMMKGLEPTKINVVRMDTEGHEYKILQGMEKLMNSNQPLLLFIEFHDTLVSKGKLKDILDLLKSKNFKFIYGCNDYFTGMVEELYSFDELSNNLKLHAGAEVFIKRGY